MLKFIGIVVVVLGFLELVFRIPPIRKATTGLLTKALTSKMERLLYGDNTRVGLDEMSRRRASEAERKYQFTKYSDLRSKNNEA